MTGLVIDNDRCQRSTGRSILAARPIRNDIAAKACYQLCDTHDTAIIQGKGEAGIRDR